MVGSRMAVDSHRLTIGFVVSMSDDTGLLGTDNHASRTDSQPSIFNNAAVE